jgi:hypothetical protein
LAAVAKPIERLLLLKPCVKSHHANHKGHNTPSKFKLSQAGEKLRDRVLSQHHINNSKFSGTSYALPFPKVYKNTFNSKLKL